MNFEIVVHTTSPGYSKSRGRVDDTFVGSEEEATAYAREKAHVHAERIYMSSSRGHVTRTANGAKFETTAGTLVQYSSIPKQTESE